MDLVKPTPAVMVAEDDADMRALIANALRRRGHTVVEAGSGSELLELIGSMLMSTSAEPPIRLILSDVRMPSATGLDVLAGLRRTGWRIPFVLFTAFGSSSLHRKARSLGADAVLNKPFRMNDLFKLVDVLCPVGNPVREVIHAQRAV